MQAARHRPAMRKYPRSIRRGNRGCIACYRRTTKRREGRHREYALITGKYIPEKLRMRALSLMQPYKPKWRLDEEGSRYPLVYAIPPRIFVWTQRTAVVIIYPSGGFQLDSRPGIHDSMVRALLSCPEEYEMRYLPPGCFSRILNQPPDLRRSGSLIAEMLRVSPSLTLSDNVGSFSSGCTQEEPAQDTALTAKRDNALKLLSPEDVVS